MESLLSTFTYIQSQSVAVTELPSRSWEALCGDIIDKKCIPIIGAGASAPWLPLAKDIVKEWAIEFDYPEDWPLSLAAVAQFVATTYGDERYPKKLLAKRLRELNTGKGSVFRQPDFGASIYGALAKLDLPIYLTTNYDHLMEEALLLELKKPFGDSWLRKDYLTRKDRIHGFTPSNPLVFHLHGHMYNPASMLLTEDDFVCFAYGMTKQDPGDFLGREIDRQFNEATPLYLGYSLRDMNFRILLKYTLSRNKSLAVMLPEKYPKSSLSEDKIKKYLDTYYEDIFKTTIFWGDLKEFLLCCSLITLNLIKIEKNPMTQLVIFKNEISDYFVVGYIELSR